MSTCMETSVETLSAPPLCGLTNQDVEENEADQKNAYSCMCTDKIFIGTVFKCILKTCDSSDVNDAFQNFYGMCDMYGDTTFPAPDKFLSVVGITTTLTASDLMPTGYTTNSVFPALTATTWSKVIGDPDSASHSAFWATATATSDDGAVSFGKATMTAAGSSQGTGTAAISGGAAASAVESGNSASGNQFVGGAMAAAVVGVAGLVAFL
jgi:hypothetical protein